MNLRDNLLIVTEKQKEEQALQAIFREEIARGEVSIESCLTSSGAIGSVRSTLLFQPSRPVALVVNAGDDPVEQVEEERAAIGRLLRSDAAVDKTWHATIARPDVDAWLLADPEVKAIFDAEEVTRRSRQERAARIGEMVKVRPLDREAIGAAHPEFRSLVAFVESHLLVARTTV